MMVAEIGAEVVEACGAAANVLTPSFYHEHIRVVEKYASGLAIRLGADVEIVELAALLHDISAVRDFSSLPRHAAASAELARARLVEGGYPAERADAVAEAIVRHSEPMAVGEASLEAVCLAHADAMAQIAMPTYWLWFAFRVRQLGYEEGKRWYAERVRQSWQRLIPEARELLGARYDEVTAVLDAVSR